MTIQKQKKNIKRIASDVELIISHEQCVWFCPEKNNIPWDID
jgi:hypothetical protein